MQINSKSYVVLFDLDASGNPVTQSVVGVTDSSGNAVTGIISVGDPAPFSNTGFNNCIQIIDNTENLI